MLEKLIGKKLGDLAEQTGMFWNVIHVFVLEDTGDDTGKHFMDAYCLRQVVKAHPAARDAVVVTAYDFCGEHVLRVRF